MGTLPFDLIMISSQLAKHRQHFGIPIQDDVTLYLESGDGCRICINYKEFVRWTHPMYRTAIIELERPVERGKRKIKFAQIIAISGIASEVARVLGEFSIPESAIHDHTCYVLFARAIDDPRQHRLPVIRKQR